MKKLLLLIGMFACSFVAQSQEYLEMIDQGTYTVAEIIENAEAYFVDKDKGRGSGYKQFKRWEYNALRMAKDDGYLPSLTERLAEVEAQNAYLNSTAGNRQVLNDNWEELGPYSWNQAAAWSPGVGRVTGIAIDQTDSDHMIIGANTGGVWRTTNGGQDWTPMGDYFSNLYVYSVAIDPLDSATYYFGSADGLIFKSTDSGATWNSLGDLGTSVVNRILIHPTNTNIMFATAQNGGIKRSVDGGTTWTTAIADSRGYDVEFKPGDPNTVYVSGNGFHYSTNGGATFTTVTSFSPAAKMIGVSPDNDQRVYVLEAAGGSFGGIYYSDDSGVSFTELDHAGRNYFGYDTNGNQSGGQAPRDMDIAVSPADADEVHIAGVLTWRSFDGGANFENTSDWIPQQAAGSGKGYHHADVDILLFNGTTLFVGSDGGIFKADDTINLNAAYYEDITDGLGIRQFYKIGVSQTQDVVVTGGSQDNGTGKYSVAEGWIDWVGADGMETFVDKFLPTTLYATSQFGELYRSSNGGQSLSFLPEPGNGSGNWVVPFEQDPIDNNTIYVGYRRFHKSTNRGNSWTAISQDFGGFLDELKIAPSNNQVMYASRGGFMYKTEDQGATDWVQLPNIGGLINSISIHPTDPNRVAVASSSFANAVVVSEDGGQTWQNYDLNLPNFSALTVIWDHNGKHGLYLGMDYGLYYIDDTFIEWQPYNNMLANVIVNELEINNETNTLYAGTYGRGLWASPLVDSILGTEDFLSQEGVSIYPNPANETIAIQLQNEVVADIRLFDVVGKLVVYQPKVDLGTTEHTIDVSGLNNGIYFVRINSNAGAITKKIIKN